jgi:prepilin signal peptidase PulO-like enzyme (type II secretory pathway)
MLGWRAVIFTMFVTVVLGAIGAFVYLVFAALLRNRYQAFTALPYGPYIVIATVLMLLFRAEMGQFFGAYFP